MNTAEGRAVKFPIDGLFQGTSFNCRIQRHTEGIELSVKCDDLLRLTGDVIGFVTRVLWRRRRRSDLLRLTAKKLFPLLCQPDQTLSYAVWGKGFVLSGLADALKEANRRNSEQMQ